MEKNNNLEILAPAGDFTCLKAAINAGADAIYMGGSRFGARAYAGNFDSEEVLKAIDYVHMYGKKMYLTVNTLLYEHEIGLIYDYLSKYYEQGLDAVIVQDLGVLEKIHRLFPDLPIHLSTQTTITTGLNDTFFKDNNVTRVVPARELNIEEIRKLCEDTSMEVEVFVHGALCYAYSGQCIMSSIRGNRSGNRGKCAGSCRLPFLTDCIGKGHILSLKENCALELFGELAKAGVDSYKIEGRMKKPSYVAMITSVYSKYKKLYESLGYAGYKDYVKNHRSELDKDIFDMSDIYNRAGFTCSYLRPPRGADKEKIDKEKYVKDELKQAYLRHYTAPADMLSFKRPNHGGVRVGTVTDINIKKNECTFKTEIELGPHDVLDFRDEEMNVKYEYTTAQGFKIGRYVNARYKKGCGIRKGDSVYRTRNESLLEKVNELYINQDKKIPIKLCFRAYKGEKPSLTLNNDSAYVTVYGDNETEKSQSQKPDSEKIKKALCQFGNTIMEVSEVEIDVESDAFIPMSVVKDIRRKGVEKLTEVLLAKYRRELQEKRIEKRDETERNDRHKKQDYKQSEFKESYQAQILTGEQFDAVLGFDKIGTIIIRLELFSTDEILELAEEGVKAGKDIYIALPRIIRYDTLDCLKSVYRDALLDDRIKGYLVNCFDAFGLAFYFKKIKPEKIIITGPFAYTLNSAACRAYIKRGAESFSISYELKDEDLERIPNDLREAMCKILYCKAPLMVSANCVQKNVAGCVGKTKEPGIIKLNCLDNMEAEVSRMCALNFCRFCYNEIYMEKPIFDLKKISFYKSLGIGSYRLEFTTESAAKVREILCKI